MEHMSRRCVSKPPLYPRNHKLSATVKPLKMVAPLPLSEAFENSLHFLDPPKETGPREPPVVDLNVSPINPEGDGEMKYCKKPVIDYQIIEKKFEEVASGSSGGRRFLTLDEAFENEKCGRNMDCEDERRLRRTVSNRLSAQRSRMKKSLYISEMKTKIIELQDKVANMSPELETFKQKQMMLKMQKTVLEQQLRRCMNQSTLCNRQIDEKRAEIKRLKELLWLKNEQMMMMINSTDYVAGANWAGLSLCMPPRMVGSSLLQCEPKPEPPEGMGVDQQGGGIEQYLNMEAISFSSTQLTDV